MVSEPPSAAPARPVPEHLAAALDHNATAALCGISPSHLFALIRRGAFGPSPIYMGRCKRYLRDEVLAWLAAGAPARGKWLAMRQVRTA